MPRTKKPRKVSQAKESVGSCFSKQSDSECDEKDQHILQWVQDFDKQFEIRLQGIQAKINDALNGVDSSIVLAKLNISSEDGNKPPNWHYTETSNAGNPSSNELGESIAQVLENVELKFNKPRGRPRTHANSTIENSIPHQSTSTTLYRSRPTVTLVKPRPSRSCTRNPRAKKSLRRTRSASIDVSNCPYTGKRLKTPMTTNRIEHNGSAMAPITPKVHPERPRTIMRHPIQGEMAISMSGSPLLVTSVMTNKDPYFSIPLEDGRVLSVMPEKSHLNPDDVPTLDLETKEKLKTLMNHIQAFVD